MGGISLVFTVALFVQYPNYVLSVIKQNNKLTHYYNIESCNNKEYLASLCYCWGYFIAGLMGSECSSCTDVFRHYYVGKHTLRSTIISRPI